MNEGFGAPPQTPLGAARPDPRRMGRSARSYAAAAAWLVVSPGLFVMHNSSVTHNS